MRPATHDSDVRARMGRELKRTSAKTVEDARQRLTSTSGTRASFDFELIDEYANSRLSSVLAVPALVLILAVFASLWVSPFAAAAWATLVILTNSAAALLCRRYKRADPTKFNASRWTTTFIAAEMVHGIAWALLTVFSFIGADTAALQVAMFAMGLVGIASNAVTTRTLPPATLVSTLPSAVAVTIILAMAGGTLNWSLAAVTIGGEIFFVYLAKQLYTSELETVVHQAEKDALIAELEEAREMSDEARRHAERANEAKSYFLATMSHELRTPLTSIIGNAELMEIIKQSPRDRLISLHAIQDSGRHLLSLISDLVDISRIEAGRYQLHEAMVSLVDIAEDCRRMIEMRAKAKGIDLSASYAKGLPKVWGDERGIRQVALNLLSNAVKFTPQSGKIHLMVTRSRDGGQLISVRDNGPGIPEDEIATALSSFGQGSLAQKTAEQGAGLGLPIVQKIMELHQGRFDLFSKLRFGTEVIATFPRARVVDALAPVVEKNNKLKTHSGVSEEPTVDTAETSADVSKMEGAFLTSATPAPRLGGASIDVREFGKMSVLVVEDELAILHVIKSIVISSGNKCSIATDGEIAIELLKSQRFDCVLLDMNLPGMRGTEVKALFDSIEYDGARPAFFAVTGDVMPEQRKLYLSQGFIGIVSKPFDGMDILKALDDADRYRERNADIYEYPSDFTAERINKLEMALSQGDFVEGLQHAANSLAGYGSRLSEAIEGTNQSEIRRICHGISGTAGQYGLGQLYDRARYAEENAADMINSALGVQLQQSITLAIDTLSLLIASRQKN